MQNQKMKKVLFSIIVFCFWQICFAQDSTIFVGEKAIMLSEVVVNKQVDVPTLISRIKADSSFYKAFRNLHIIGFTAINDIRMLDKDGNLQASLNSKTKQLRDKGCRTMQVMEEKATGDFYDENRNYNYYTAQMYASLFFTQGKVCGEDNIVAGREFSTAGKSGMEKHKEQLKMLFFNPGRRISGLPFMSNKTAIYEDEMADKYNMAIDMEDYNGKYCYVFKQKVKPGSEDKVVINEMNTWFDYSTMNVVARTYNLSYSAWVYDFDVQMEVQMSQVGNLTVPVLIRYNGNWKAITKKRERGVFTAVLSDFTQ